MADDVQVDAASVAIFRGVEVLLTQRTVVPYKGFWTLPGGRVESGETEEECARREISEELGLAISAQFVTRHAAGAYRLAVFAATCGGGEVHKSAEIADWRWVRLEAIADLKVTPGLADIVGSALLCAQSGPIRA